MVAWWHGGMVAWWHGGMVHGGMVAWWHGGMVACGGNSEEFYSFRKRSEMQLLQT
jgi:hypothetical protein